jgi:mono/diheme cytochrome c family protein
MKKFLILISFLISSLLASELDDKKNLTGKQVFETYCWGCHHQTAVAFGPPFNEIAAKRTKDEIEAYIISPKSMYKAFGYKRTVMTQFNLSDKERDLIADYILSFKGKK